MFFNAINAGTLQFNNSIRTKVANTTFIRSANTNNKDKLWLKLSNNKSATQIGIAFLENCSNEYKSKEDVKAITGRTLNFYTKSTDEDLVIDAQHNFNDNKMIPLGITILKKAMW